MQHLYSSAGDEQVKLPANSHINASNCRKASREALVCRLGSEIAIQDQQTAREDTLATVI